MQNITNYETKEIECERCGWVGTVAKHIPLKQAWCGGCRSSRIRLHKRLLTQRAPDWRVQRRVKANVTNPPAGNADR